MKYNISTISRLLNPSFFFKKMPLMIFVLKINYTLTSLNRIPAINLLRSTVRYIELFDINVRFNIYNLLYYLKILIIFIKITKHVHKAKHMM